MNERFKFRAWDKIRGKYEDLQKLINQKGELVSFAVRDDLSEFYDIEQCTGLKDKNGKLIYENDLIKCPNGIYRIAVDDFGLWTAIYENNPLKDVVEWSDIVKNYAFSSENVELEVLGNIHENADLLEAKNDNR